MKKGIDVSFAQGKVDWKKVKASDKVDFAIIRAGFGREICQEDSQFKNNYAGAKTNGIPIGVYWYSYAESAEDAKREAKACMEVIKGKQFEYPIYFDLEEQFQLSNGKAFCDSLVKAFCSELEKGGYWAGLYCSTSWLNSCISPDVAKRYALWVAQYYDECTYTAAPVGMWQYSSTTSVSGISGNVDGDECYVDYPTLIKAKGLNGFKKTTLEGDLNGDGKIDVRDKAYEEAHKPQLDKSGYIRGDKTIGTLALKELLLIAKQMGVSRYGMYENQEIGDGTITAVNALLNKWGYQKTGIAGENFIKRLASEIRKKV